MIVVVISLENEQLFTKNTKILKIVLFSLIHNEMGFDRNPTEQIIISSLLKGHFRVRKTVTF